MGKQSSPNLLGSGASGWRTIGGGALIFAATFLAYLPAINGGFLWDDDAHVTKASLRSVEGLWRIWTEPGASQQYYPVLHSAFWLEHRLWGDAVLGYHIVNVLLHATAACLLVAIVRRLFGPAAANGNSRPPPPVERRYPGVEWLAGFLFALHPVAVESVAWISEQKNTLSTVFYLGAAFTYLKFDRDRHASRYWQALGLFVLALLSKTVTATLPAALLVVFWWQHGRIEWRRDVQPLLPWFVMGISAGFMTAWVEHTFFVAVQMSQGAPVNDFTLSIVERCLLAGRVVWFYAGKLLWPAELIFTYPQWDVDGGVAWQYLFPLGLIVLVGGLAVVARRRRGPLAALLFFTGTLFPALGFINVYPFIYSYVADHFQYLASLGLIVPVAFFLADRRHGPTAGVMLVAILGVLTWRQSRMYRDVETLYRETLARNPSSWMAHGNLGLLLAKTPEGLPAALTHFEAAVRLKPQNAEVHNYLGSALARTPGRQREAVGEFETALRLAPGFPHAHVNLGVALMDEPARFNEALGHLESAVKLKPDLAGAHHLLGCALARIPSRQAEAIRAFETALRLDPDLLDAHSNLAIVLAGTTGREADALRHFEAAVRLAPDSAVAHYNFGYALAETPGRLSQALAEFEAAVRLDPRHVEAQFALAATLANLPERRAEALRHFERVLQLQPEHGGARQWVEALRRN